MKKNIINTLRWIAVIPAGYIGGFLLTFPFHWLLQIKMLLGSDTLFGILELNPSDFDRFEIFLTPFIIAMGFVWIGSYVAPSKKKMTAIVLAAVHIAGILLIFTLTEYASFELRTLFSIIGAVVSVYIVGHTEVQR